MRKTLFVILLVLPFTNALSQGYLTGVINLDDGSPLAQANVRVFNAVNAEIADQTVTDNTGSFMTGPISPGTYKVRVDRIFNDDAGVCISQVAEYLGDDSGGSVLHADVFDTAKTFTVVDGTTTQVSGSAQQNSCQGVKKCVSSALGGRIVDKDTGEYINGIVVEAKDPVNAMPETTNVVSQNTIDGDGYFRANVTCFADGKVRFFDPTGKYSPEYYQDQPDDFSLGNVIDYGNFANLNEVYLSQASPSQQIQNLSDQISNLSLTDQTVSSLTNTLGQATTLLLDQNPNNDKSSCGLLRAFINKLDGLVASGEITSEERDTLANEASTTSQSLGCK